MICRLIFHSTSTWIRIYNQLNDLQAGLYNKWVTDLLTETKLRSQRRQRQHLAAGHNDQAPQPEMINKGTPILTISHTQGAFILLMLGFLFAILVFTKEVLPIFD